MADRANIYILTGESYMINKSVRDLKKKAQNPQLNVTEYKGMPASAELISACAQVPFMSDTRFVSVAGCSVLNASGSAEEAKKIAVFLERMPDTTILAMCSAEPPDKRRALYKYVKKNGTVREFAPPGNYECASFVEKQAKAKGAAISAKAAAALVSVAGRDYYTLENEVDKLAVYSGFGEITLKHIAECASRSLEYNVFEIHNLLADKQADKAFALLADILEQERPEALIGLFARKIRDMYKVKTMRDAGFSEQQTAKQLALSGYAVSRLIKDCSRFTADSLRRGIGILADTDYGIKSGGKDAALALNKALVCIYGL